MAQLMCAQPETGLEVDLIILDFLTFQASNGLFREYALRSNSAQVADYDSRIAENDLRLAHCRLLELYKFSVQDLQRCSFFRPLLIQPSRYSHANNHVIPLQSYAIP